MAKIVLLGAGVMGSALASVAAFRNEVTLIGSPLDGDIISIVKNHKPHPTLHLDVPRSVVAVDSNEITADVFENADVVVLGVSSPGVQWALGVLERHKVSPDILALLTKGLVSSTEIQSAPITYAQAIDASMTTPAGRIVGIGGPCIARELALEQHTRVCFASEQITAANSLRNMLETDYYHIATHKDFTGLEACAALKNFMCIGVSAMFTAYAHDKGHAKNPLAALFNQAVREIALLSRWIKSDANAEDEQNSNSSNTAHELAFDLAGLGDLHVTVGGGRNSKLGQYLGTGRRLTDILQSDMHNVTVEGVDTARQLSPGFQHACELGKLHSKDFPLTQTILDVVENDQRFTFDFKSLPG